MSIEKELRKIADRLDQSGAVSARSLRVSLNQYHVFERVRKIGPVKNVLDVGANKGELVRTLARAFPEAHLHAFEPVAEIDEPNRLAVDSLFVREATDKLNSCFIKLFTAAK